MQKLIRLSFFCAFAVVSALADVRGLVIGSWNLDDIQMPIEEKWNNTITGLLSGSKGVDVLALQEVGGLPSNAVYLNTFHLTYANRIPVQEYQWEIGRGQERVFIYFVRTDTEMNGINLAIVSKRRANEVFVIRPHSKRGSKNALPMLAIRLDSSVIVTMDSMDSKGDDVQPSLVSVLEFFAAHKDANALEWFIAGSFNISPQNLQAKILPKLQERIAIIAPQVSTRKSGGVLDYAISGNSGDAPYLASPMKSYLGYGNVRLQFDSNFIPLIFSK